MRSNITNKEAKILIDGLLIKMNNNTLTKEEYHLLQKLLIEYENIYRDDTREKNINPTYPLCKTSITGDKIMFISDTHHGNEEYENRIFTDIAYNSALRQNIKTVIHAGDFTESTTAPGIRRSWDYNTACANIRGEVQTALTTIPKELQIKLLLGNHDYTTIRRFPMLSPLYTDSSQFDILGMNRVLLDWDSFATLYLWHDVSSLKTPRGDDYYREKNSATVTLEGHHHTFNIRDDDAICLPSLSNATLNPYSFYLYQKGYEFSPIFVIASKEDNDKIRFEAYSVEGNQAKYYQTINLADADVKTKKLTRY